MTDLTKIKISKILYSASFSLPIYLLYFSYRNLSPTQAYLSLGLYSIGIVLLEFPTGVIGDYFGHLFSTKLGQLIYATSLFICAFSGNPFFYYIFMMLGSLGISLISGSFDAILYTYSPNYKKDYSFVEIASIIVLFISTSTAGYFYSINPSLPLVLTGCSFILGFVFLSLIKNKKDTSDKSEGNIFKKAKEGIKISVRTPIVLKIILLSSLFTAVFLSFKWLQTPLFESLQISYTNQGILFGIFILISAIGVRIYQNNHFKIVTFVFILIPILLFTISALTNSYISLALIPLLNLSKGSGNSMFNVVLNKQIPDKNRASVLSFNSMITRIFYSGLTFMFGITIPSLGLSKTLMIVGTISTVSVIFFLINRRHFLNK